MADLTNAQIAAAFDELGDLYELDGAVSYRVIAYRTAAKAVRESSVSVVGLSREGRVTELSGVGKTLEEKIKALDETGEIPASKKLRDKFPTGLIQVMHLPGFGPKRARRLYDELGIDSLDALRAAAEEQKIRTLRGFGAKVEEQLLKTLAESPEGGPAPRIVLSRAQDIAEEIVGALRSHPSAERVEVAGSLRRRADSVKDLDIIATAQDPVALSAALAELPLVESVLSAGDAGARVLTHSGMKVDLRVVEPDQFGNVLQHFTGSKAHNVALRESAVRRGLHVSEYGILDDETGETLRCATEEEVYERLGLAWIPPELREGRGELEAAANGSLPRLLTEEDIRGDLHCHTTLSDGRQTLEQMAEAALARGLEYLAVTDHSASHGFGDHVTPEALEARIDEVHALNAKLDGLELLAGQRGQHPHRRLARLRGRAAGPARLGDRVDPHVVRDGREGDDRAHDRRGRAPARRRDRAPDRPQDREAPGLRDRHGEGHRGGGEDRDDDRDQRSARPPGHERAARPRGGGGRRQRARQHRRALGAQLRPAAVRDRHRAARLADAGAGGEHAPLGGVRAAAQARPLSGGAPYWRRVRLALAAARAGGTGR